MESSFSIIKNDSEYNIGSCVLLINYKNVISVMGVTFFLFTFLRRKVFQKKVVSKSPNPLLSLKGDFNLICILLHSFLRPFGSKRQGRAGEGKLTTGRNRPPSKFLRPFGSKRSKIERWYGSRACAPSGFAMSF